MIHFSIRYLNDFTLPQQYLPQYKGDVRKLLRVHGWLNEKVFSDANEVVQISYKGQALLTLRIIHDKFNSEIFQIPQARLYFFIHPTALWSNQLLSKLSRKLHAYLTSLSYSLISVKVIGHSVQEFKLLEKTGFHLMLGSMAFQMPKSKKMKAIDYDRNKYQIEIFDLSTQSVPQHYYSEILEIARASRFEDRFSLDPEIPEILAEQRFYKIVENTMNGLISDYIALSKKQNKIMGLIALKIKDNYGGPWFTAISRPNPMARGFNNICFSHLMDHLKAENIKWTYTCSISNTFSIRIASHFHFSPKAISYDFHFWNYK